MAVDALRLKQANEREEQFQTEMMVREIRKAYAGFSVEERILDTPYTHIASGNW